MESLINNDLDLSLSDGETDSEPDNETEFDNEQFAEIYESILVAIKA